MNIKIAFTNVSMYNNNCKCESFEFKASKDFENIVKNLNIKNLNTSTDVIKDKTVTNGEAEYRSTNYIYLCKADELLSESETYIKESDYKEDIYNIAVFHNGFGKIIYSNPDKWVSCKLSGIGYDTSNKTFGILVTLKYTEMDYYSTVTILVPFVVCE